MSKSKKHRRQAMILELANAIMFGAYKPLPEEDLNNWCKRVSKSIVYDKHCGKTRLTEADIKISRALAMKRIEDLESRKQEYYDPRTKESLTINSNQ